MADLLETGAAWLDDQRHRHLSRPVVYQRGADTVAMNATIGRTVFEQADEYGAIRRVEARDFLIRTADLVLAETMTLPKAGDQIRETQDGQVFVYAVMAPSNEPPFRYSDAYRRTLRIHTKQVATEEA